MSPRSSVSFARKPGRPANKPKIQYEKIENWGGGGNAQPGANSYIGGTFTGVGVGGGINPFGFPGSLGGAQNQLSQPTTAFVNLRWYFISNMRQLLCELYVEIGLVQKLVNLPVDDAFRGGVEIQSKQLDEAQLEELRVSSDRDENLVEVSWGVKWARLFGGGAVIIFTDQDPEEPLDISAITEDSFLEFKAVDMWEIFWDQQVVEGWSPESMDEFEFYSYYGQKCHKSRVMRIEGLQAPSFLRPRLRGWGFSIVESFLRPLNQYLKASSLTYEVLDEFKVDVYKIKDYANTLLTPDGGNAVNRRINDANYMKNYNNALVMDSQDDWDHKQLSFAGLAEAGADNRIQIACEASIPLTKLFGVSAAGFNSGEDDIEVYNSMIEGTIRDKVKYVILRLYEIKCQKLFGFIPDDLSISFNPLRVLSAEQEQNIKTQKAGVLQLFYQLGSISPEEVRKAINKGNLLDIQLEDENMVTGGFDDDTIGEGENDPDNPVDVEDPGTDRADTPKPKSGQGGAGKEPFKPKGLQSDELPPDPGSRSKNSKGIFKKIVHAFNRNKNSDRFDKASYMADGGDGWIQTGRLPFYEDPGDKGLWAKCISESKSIYGSENRKFTIWLYKKRGGSFPF